MIVLLLELSLVSWESEKASSAHVAKIFSGVFSELSQGNTPLHSHEALLIVRHSKRSPRNELMKHF